MGGDPHLAIEDLVAAAVANVTPETTLLIPPLMHGAAIYSLLTALLTGSPRVLTPNFDPLEILRLVEAEKISGITVVGDAIARPISDAIASVGNNYDLSTLKTIGSGGALLSPVVKEQLKSLLPKLSIRDAFGASESGYNGIIEVRDDGTRRIVANPNMLLVDENLLPLPPGTGKIGLLARYGHVPVSYFNDPEKSAATFPVIEGVRMAILGDMGLMEESGAIILLGRGSLCINSGGEKIFPEEVEQILKSHPGVVDAVVAGVPDERFGEKVSAVIEMRFPDHGVDAGEISEYCREFLSGYKIPRTIIFVPSISRSPSGKPDYRWAREILSSSEG